MIPDDMIDGFLASGVLPGVRLVTVENPAGTVSAELDARREDATEEQKAGAGLTFGAEAVTFFIPVAQAGYVRARNNWVITDTGGDGTAWVVRGDAQKMQNRGLECVCTRRPD